MRSAWPRAQATRPSISAADPGCRLGYALIAVRLVMTEYVTLDAVMEAPNRWSFPFWNDEAAKFKFDELFASDALLLGRVTYPGFAAAWPSMSDPFADRMNGLVKYVVSTTVKNLTWSTSRLLGADVAAEIPGLKQEPGQDILVGGSATLVQALM